MKYTNIKSSNVEWLGDIPSHWEIKRGKNCLTLLSRSVLDDDDIITCFRDGEVTLRKNRREEGFTNALLEIGYQGVNAGDLVVHGMDGFAGAIGISDSRGKASPVLNVMDSPNCKRFLMYYLRSLANKEVFLSLSTGIRVRSCDLRWNKLAVLPFILPPLPEQDAIAAYLDDKCGAIDEIIEQAKASIEEYKAWKSSVIFEAVTKGLNPNAEMKDSGVEWIGKVPSNANTVRLRTFISKIESGVSVNAGQEPAQSNEIGVLKTSAVSQYIFIPSENKNVNKDEINRVSCPVKKNTLIVSRMNTPELVGACGYVDSDYKNLFLPDRLWQVHFEKECSVKFMWYYLRSNFVRNYYASLSTGTSSSMQNISQSQFSNVLIVNHPINIQEEIADYLDEKCDAIDGIIAEKEALIADMEAYKKSLIFETVTGKRKVC